MEEEDTISLVLIRERSFGKQRGNNNLGLIPLLLAKYHPSPLCMRSLVWLFSRLIAEVPGSYALLTCSDKPLASFGAKRDFSPRSLQWLSFPLLCRERPSLLPQTTWAGVSDLLPVPSVGIAFCGNSLLQEWLAVFYYKPWNYNGTLRSTVGWSQLFLCPRSHPTLPPMLEFGLSSPKIVPCPLKSSWCVHCGEGDPLQAVAAGK